MANTKNSVNKKKTSSKKKVNQKKKNQVNHSKIIETVDDFKTDYKRIVLVVGIIIIIFCVFYFLTVYITGRDNQNTQSQTTSDSTFSYTDIIAGRSFSMPENEYLVLYYDQNDEELSGKISTLISDYSIDSTHLALYSVDMGNGINQKYISEESNPNPDSVSDLAIAGTTLIHFKDGIVIDYMEGMDTISSYLD